ncbi:hypothetical protein BST81_17040 [Leptolyngbya sp. 'hensonii']|uniref:hypothetical protein n=1 Tax=Leptolyngbya sp. 'hensonii' TaxID=1922337 RepID=UPI00094FC5B0|nr:hypothetical protein [Leptolyngbya sp. 'hensonii']OLP17065.1 hypothetical protein BST81_17040 [Leptolyngbya sp. 'hensonii']
MKLIKLVLITVVILASLLLNQPAWADAGKFKRSPDYAEVVQAIDTLLQSKDNPEASLTPEQLQLKLADLQLQKYILETSETRASCRNATGKTLAVYLRSKKVPADQPGTLYYLGDGQTTDDDFACQGVFLPAGSVVTFSPLDSAQELTEPLALKIVEGTQFAIDRNPETGVVAFNLPPAQSFKVGEGTWSIPSLTQADIDAQVPNAPAD